jgi:hypothetical protein
MTDDGPETVLKTQGGTIPVILDIGMVLTRDSDNNGKRVRNWVFTWNNWEPDTPAQLIRWLEMDETTKYVFSEEYAPTTGTPHLQGAIFFRTAHFFSALKEKLPTCYLAPCRKSKIANERYCSKTSGKLYTNIENLGKEELTRDQVCLMEEYTDVIWKPWQKEILALMDSTDYSRRHINWFYHIKGDIGKSFIMKYLSLKYDCIICTGKTDDIFNQLLTWAEANPKKKAPDALIIDLPMEHDSINVHAVESIQNGMVYSGKYKGGKLHLTKLRTIVVANHMPRPECVAKLSADRWIYRPICLDE